MITGYVLENFLGFSIALAQTCLQGIAGNSKLLNRCSSVLRRGCSCFYDCAVFFTFSIQLACIVVLARLDFGVSASGMGDSTAKITWAVSLLTILPLMYIAFNPELLREPEINTNADKNDQKENDRKEQLRFVLFALCWLLFVYPFLSRMMETFGPSMIGGHNAVVSTSDWDKIQKSCVANVDSITNNETLAMEFFAVAGSLFVCLLALAKIIWLAIQRQHENSALVTSTKRHLLRNQSHQRRLSIALFIAIPIIAISQLWTILRLRGFQEQISQASGYQDSDGQWTFGQIAAVTIFVPVLVECWFAWLCE